MVERRPLTQLTDTQRAQAQQRFVLLRPFLEDGVPLTRLARQHGVPLRTARRWVAAYRAHGLAGLVRRPRADRGRHRRVHPDLVRLIEGLALQAPPPTAAAVHRRVLAVAARRGWPPPRYRTVAALIRRLDPALVALAHHGVRAYREAYDLLHRFEAGRPNELWQADHQQLDLWVPDAQGRPARPWLTVILDDYSRAVAGYFLGVAAPTALQTAEPSVTAPTATSTGPSPPS